MSATESGPFCGQVMKFYILARDGEYMIYTDINPFKARYAAYILGQGFMRLAAKRSSFSKAILLVESMLAKENEPGVYRYLKSGGML